MNEDDCEACRCGDDTGGPPCGSCQEKRKRFTYEMRVGEVAIGVVTDQTHIIQQTTPGPAEKFIGRHFKEVMAYYKQFGKVTAERLYSGAKVL